MKKHGKKIPPMVVAATTPNILFFLFIPPFKWRGGSFPQAHLAFLFKEEKGGV